MAFDVDMVKAVYAHLGERIAAARKLTGRPLTLTEKFSTPIFLKGCQPNRLNAVNHTLILTLIVLPCRMQPLKWLCYNLCKPEE